MTLEELQEVCSARSLVPAVRLSVIHRARGIFGGITAAGVGRASGFEGKDEPEVEVESWCLTKQETS